jgi:capsid protein
MQRAAACKADWRGPAKPTADDMKTAKANEVLLLNKLATREQLCAELGTDYYENFEQIAQEQEEADELGIDLAPPPKGPGGGGGGSPFGRAEGEAEEEEPREPENG